MLESHIVYISVCCRCVVNSMQTERAGHFVNGMAETRWHGDSGLMEGEMSANFHSHKAASSTIV